MATYQVKQGKRFGVANQYGPTDKIELSVEEASGFLDKLELVEVPVEDTSPAGAVEATLAELVSSTGTGWGGLDLKVVALLEAAEVTPDMATTLTDEELLAIDGIGPKAIEKIWGALSGNAE